MLNYLVRRVLWMIPTLLGISLVAFALVHLVPGDPAQLQFGSESTGAANAGEAIASFRRAHLLDQPLWKQYLHYVGPFNLGADGHTLFGGSGARPWGGLLAADLGREFLRPDVSVASEIATRLKVTVPLALISALLAYLIAIPLGIYAALRRGTRVELATSALLFAMYSVPVFWAGLMLQLAFGRSGLDWLPVIGISSADADALGPAERALDTVRHVVLPIVCLTYGGLAYLSRQMRASMLEALRSDYVRAARAKGLTETSVVFKHALRNSAVPLCTLFGQVLPILMGGSVLVETVFDLPGLGRYAYEGLSYREYNVVLGTVLLAALMTLVGFLLSDVLCALVDPRIRQEGGSRG